MNNTKIESLRDSFMNELIEIAREEKRIVALDADVGSATRTSKFGEVYPDRFYELGVAEQNTFGVASGLAAAGGIVFAATFAVFASMRAAEMIRTSICYPKRNVKIIGGYAGLSNGKDGATHQSIEDIAIMRSFPNLIVMSPADSVIARKMAKAAVEHDGPMYLRMEYENLPSIYNKDLDFKIGKGYVIREGMDVTVLSYGTALHRVMEAADILSKEGISVEVIDIPTIKPLDKETIIQSIKKTGTVITFEDHSIIGGLCSAVCESIVEAGLSPKFKSLGIGDVFTESGKTNELREKYSLDTDSVTNAARNLVCLKGGKQHV